ncbi:MAG: phospholipid/cholesterol/gamma-HCH transport system substrate-binding protein [Solirubrobacteraceae bacterium]|nr:phospholipid/cholesterol/gamma-HCH transport system substrate-binding protein [Solirubrobacteraceae bacterium]
MRRAIRKHLRDFAAIVALAAIATGVGGYVLSNQRLRFPWQGATFRINAEFATAQAVTPGQGQTVRVSGVRVGDISKVALKDGRAIVTMDLDPQYKDLVRTDATALLRPKTGLKDMFIELDPGTGRAPLAHEGSTVPVRNTAPDVNPDEILSVLDDDTRDYLKLLIGGAGQGLKGRGNDLRDLFRRFEPTHKDLARVNAKVALRHRNLRRLVHSLQLLNHELAGKDDQLAALVDSSSKVFRTFASEQGNLGRAVGDLPGTLRQTTDTLGKVERFARVLGPTADDLRPPATALNRANAQLKPLAEEATPIVAEQVRPFVRDARPLVRSLDAPAQNLAASTPDLTRTFTVLNHFLNLAAYNEGGRQGPDVAGRDEGYLFWLAWLQHNGAALFGSSDANGPFRPVTLGGTCTVLKELTGDNPPLNLLYQPALLNQQVCGNG